MTRAAVLGAGSWGTTFAKVLADAGCDVTLHARRPELAKAIAEDAREPATTCPGSGCPRPCAATADAGGGAATAPTIVVLAVPSQSLRDNLTRVGAAAARRRDPALADEGHRAGHDQADERGHLRGDRRRRRPGRRALRAEPGPGDRRGAAGRDRDRLHRHRARRACCRRPATRPTSGRTPTPTWSAASSAGRSRTSSRWPAGIAEGLGFGDNTRASLITRGLAETARLGMALGAELTTFAGLAGLGDLVATCSSPLSRNRTFGEKLGRGMTVEEVQESTRQTAEGVKSCRSVLDLARAHGVDVPITEAVVRVCHEGEAPAQMVREIMSREAKPE